LRILNPLTDIATVSEIGTSPIPLTSFPIYSGLRQRVLYSVKTANKHRKDKSTSTSMKTLRMKALLYQNSVKDIFGTDERNYVLDERICGKVFITFSYHQVALGPSNDVERDKRNIKQMRSGIRIGAVG